MSDAVDDVDDVITLATTLSERFDERTNDALLLRLKGLSREQREELRQRCLRSMTPSTMNLLGLCHRELDDDAGAVEWFRKSAGLGDSCAMCNLGDCLRLGVGVAVDSGEATRWYEKSASLGNSTAMYRLGNCFSNSNDNQHEDPKRSAEWSQKSADLGNSDAMVDIGICLRHGYGVAKDKTKAVEWFRRSADLGNADAMRHVGDCYLFGTGVAEDEQEAMAWYRKAKTAQSYERLGRLHKDPITSLKYHCRAMGSLSDQWSRSDCRREIIRQLHTELSIEVLQQLILQEDETEACRNEIASLKTENDALRAENEALKIEVEYQPGGTGFDEARRDFESMIADKN